MGTGISKTRRQSPFFATTNKGGIMSLRSPGTYARSLPFEPQPRDDKTIRVDKRVLIAAAAGALLLSIGGMAYWLSRPGAGPAQAAAAATATTPPQTSGQRMLETLGGLSAAHLYQSYLNIGLLADAVENDSYTEAQANGMLATVTSLMDMVDRQLDRLTAADVAKEDRQDIERIRDLAQLLRTQVAALRAYWRTGDAREARRYHQARDKAWTGLSDVLGLQ
jgi:hypothetical protein